jgi:hypothetical protein
MSGYRLIPDLPLQWRRLAKWAICGLIQRSKAALLLDHLVGASEEGLRNRQADRLRGLEVHD